MVNVIRSKMNFIAVSFILLAQKFSFVSEAVRGKADSKGTNSVDVAVQTVLRFVKS